MNDPLGPIDEPPTVTLVDGEVVLLGDRVGVSSTLAAARSLTDRLQAALGSVDARRGPDEA